MGVVGANGAEDKGSYVGFLQQVEKLKAKRLRDGSWWKVLKKKYFRDRGNNRSRPTWIGGRQQLRNGCTYGPYLMCVCEGDGLIVRGRNQVSVVNKGDSRKTAECHSRRDFGSGKGAAAIGIQKA